jgi:YD repeat-containing protein
MGQVQRWLSVWGVATKRLLTGVLFASAASWIQAQEVIPDFYKGPGIDPNRSYVNQSFAEHIDPFTGSLQLHYVDIHLPGNGGFDLSVVRSYSSAGVPYLNPAQYQGLAGVGWTIHFGRVLKKDTAVCGPAGPSVANNPVIEMPDGSRQLLTYTGTTPLALSTQRWRADCASPAGLNVYSPDGTRYDMTHAVNVSAGSTQYAWYATRITDRNGNTATINYVAGSDEITSVSTSDGRSISFQYTGSGAGSRRITSITGAGQTYSYDYTAIPGVANYQLTQVTRPGGTSWRYAYNDNLGTTAGSYLMKSLIHPEGGTISYTYDSVYFDTQANPNSLSMVVKTKAMASNGNWSFSYTPGSPNVYDTTTVNSPDGTTTYRHIGPNYSSSGTVWMVGLLMSKQVGSRQTETNTWGKQKISSQNNMRPGAFVTKVDTGEVNAPVLTQRVVTRDGAAHTTTFSAFDSHGNPGTVQESGPNSGSRSTSLTYNIDTGKWLIRQVKDHLVSGGVSTTRTFDTRGNVLSVSRDGVTTSRSYDSEGNVATATFPRSLTHTYSSYVRGIAQTEQQPESITIRRVVSDAGNVTSQTNGRGNTTTYGYDGLNRLTRITPARSSAVAISYGTSSKTATRGSLTESTSYDSFGRPASITLGGVARTYRHDGFGRVTFASNPGATVGTSYQYDILGRVTRQGNADGTAVSTSYGSGSKTVTNERQKATVYRYRSFGDPDYQVLVGVTAPDVSANVSITLTGRDQVSEVTQGGFTRRYGYNGAGYLTSVVNPETGTSTFGRDDAGNMTSRAIGTSGTTTYGYDGQNRLTSIAYPGSTPSVTKKYTATHLLSSVTTSVASRSYDYDSNDNLTSETLVASGNTFITRYGYNGLDQISSTTYPVTGRVVSYSPNALGRPTQVSGFATSVSYWPSGQLQQIDYANGARSNYGQNSRLWPSGFSTTRSTTTWLNSSYGYDGAGNLTSVADSADTAYNRTYTYDDIDRLLAANGPWGSGSHTYDGAGNLTRQTLGSASWTYSHSGSTNRLSSVSGSRSGSLSYDALGNVLGAPGADYRYDAAPNLTCVNCTSGVNTVQYAYDGLNKRVSAIKAGVKTYEVYGTNGNLLLEYAPGTGNRRTEYIYLGDKRIAQVDAVNGTTSVGLTASPNPVMATSSVSLVATVSGTGAAPTGSVVFKDGGSPLGTVALSGGRATLDTTFATAGVRSLSAAYSGDATNMASESGALSLTVSPPPATTTTTLAASPSTALVNQSVQFTAQVTGNSPTGPVTFSSGSTVLGTGTLSSGIATINTAFSTVGTNSITAAYGGDANNAASQSTAISVTINPLPATTTTLAVNGTASLLGMTAQVAGASPTGTVTFRVGGSVLGTSVLSSGSASLCTSLSATGTYVFSATYSGDGDDAASTSSDVTLTVGSGTCPPGRSCTPTTPPRECSR